MAALELITSTYYAGFLITSCIFMIPVITYFRKTRIPSNVPILKVSKLGEAADIKAFIQNGPAVMQQGYEQYSKQGRNFLVRTAEGLVFVAAPRFIEELRSAPHSVLSGTVVNDSVMQEQYTLHNIPAYDWYEFGIVRKQLTQSLGPGLPDIVDECHKAFSQEIKNPHDWSAVHMWPTSSRIVTRTANRMFYGEQLSANEEFLQVSIDYTFSIFGGAHLIRNMPRFLRHLILRLKTNIIAQKATAKKHLGPVLEARILRMQEAKRQDRVLEFEANKPKDAVQWVLDVTPPEKLKIDMLVDRMLHISAAAVHTSSITFLEAIYELAFRPEIHEDLRQEISQVMEQEGKWSLQGLAKMVKIDSFMRECARWHPFVLGGLERHAMQDYTLSDGSTITKNTRVALPHYSMYFDEEIYGPTANQFDAFRFSTIRSTPGEEMKHSFVHCSPSFMHFGYGVRACPGRFFASNEIKILLVYTLSMYDIRFPSGQEKPAGVWKGGFRMADLSANVEWKLREKPLLRLDQLVKG